MPFTVSVSPRDRADLARRLQRLERCFDLPLLRSQHQGTPEVVAYYENCHDAYRKYHSAEGAVHMALNDGDRFGPDGFYGQVRRIERSWATPPQDVLELAFGQGFNLAYLAKRHAATRFVGIDLTPAHVQIAAERMRREQLGNVTLTQGDYHALPYADASFDAVFCIESMCHAMDLRQALAEAARVLRPGGTLTLFDGYLPRPPQALDAPEALAVELVAKGMAIDGLQVLADVLATALAVGLQASEVAALEGEVMPSLRKLERVTGAIIRFPWLGRRALARRHPARGRNVLAGYLMRSAVQLGLIGYRQLVLRKEN